VKCWIFKGEVYDHRQGIGATDRFPHPQSRDR